MVFRCDRMMAGGEEARSENVKIERLHACKRPHCQRFPRTEAKRILRRTGPPHVHRKWASSASAVPKNLVDSEVMMGLLARAGAELTPRAEDADIIVVNTCSFIDSAKQESVNAILEMARHKTSGRAQKLNRRGVPGRALSRRDSQEYSRKLTRWSAPENWRTFCRQRDCSPAPASNSPFVVLPSRAEGDARATHQGRFSREDVGRRGRRFAELSLRRCHPAHPGDARTSAYIKIAEGCDHPCTFCIIPQLRGTVSFAPFRIRNRRGRAPRASGVREITLIGQDTTCYGEDFGLKDGLALLLEKLAAIEDLRWVRFLYAYPNKITGKLARHHRRARQDLLLHRRTAAARVSHVLKRMKRGGGADVFLRSIEKMRRTIPDLTLRTSFIVGFPGETEKEFDELCDFVREAEFDWMGAFAYSDQEGAGAYALDEKVSPREIERRRKHLMSSSARSAERRRKAQSAANSICCSKANRRKTELLLEGRTTGN